MKNEILNLLNEYKIKYPDEIEYLKPLDEYLENNDLVTDWNNFNGHIVSSVFVVNIKTMKVLLVYHSKLNMYLSTGGHVEISDATIKDAGLREMMEESGITNYISCSDLIDIDIHDIPYNEKLNLPKHKHFDFRYLVTVDEDTQIKIDESELSGYKWVSMDEFMNLEYLNKIRYKIKEIIKK